MNNKVKALSNYLDQCKTRRSQWESDWRDIRALVHVNANDFNSNIASHTVDIHDGTAPWALEQFAAGLHSHITNPSNRWFDLEVAGVPRELIDDWDTLEWLEDTASVIWSHFTSAFAKLDQTLHESYLDIGSFGTGIIYQQWDVVSKTWVFMSCPLADCWIGEDSNGFIDTVFRVRRMNKFQILDKFGFENTPKKIKDETDSSHCFDIYHCVKPRRRSNFERVRNTNMPYESSWFSPDLGHMFLESGFDQFPYYVTRWTKLAGQLYGRSPAHTCLPTIRMINKTEKVILKGAEKMVDPPIQLVSEGFLLPIHTVPSGLIFREEGTDPAEPLLTGGRPDIGLEMQDQKREHIIKCFYVDWILQQKNSTQMTATEVMDRRDEKLRMMAPMTGRIESEMAGPMVKRSVIDAIKYNLVPPPPDFILSRGLDVSYTSPANQAQRNAKNMNTRRFIEGIVPLADIKPDVLDAIDFDVFVQEQAKNSNSSPKIMRPPREIAAIREQNAQKQNAQEGVAAAREAAGATKDMAQAQALLQG